MANSSSFSSSATSSRVGFLKLWKKLIEKRVLTFALLIENPENLGEVVKLIYNGELTHLPPSHRFKEDYNEFWLFFYEALDSFSRNWKTISSLRKLEEEVQRSADYNRHLRKIHDGWHRARDDVQKMKDYISAYSDDVAEEQTNIKA
ncbi:hypothetical protein ACJRO7_023007 [Eucalyptus globulus]|uniref:Uncharacterized protein n=1 Tax=Eucalyptus globulus TaxID=34317 RepID=A0ABD3K0N0_EUCGL